MERAPGCRVRCAACSGLTDAHRCFLSGSCPGQSAADVAGVIFSGVCGVLPGEDCHENRAELTCISLTLLEKVTSSASSHNLPPDVTGYWLEVLRVLFEDLDLTPQLVHLFQAEDQILSHLAAKSVSTCVFYRLHTSGTVSPVWQQTCEQAFLSSSPRPELDACLWSLTQVLKKLVKAAHQEILWKLVAAFDCSINALCSKLLPEERDEVTQCVVGFTSSSRWATTFCLLLDLLEVLAASSSRCGAGVCLKSQRTTYVHSSALLTTISCCSEYFVKKRTLLLLKRAVLQRVGEDWASGGVSYPGLKYDNLNSDMGLLAQSVLKAVAGNWLERVQVEPAAFFGGTRQLRGDGGQKPDCVVLRAVSLILLKSIELHIQTAAGTGLDSATEVFGYLQSLWGFLRRRSVQLTELTHLCCWISVLFGEQDDDMIEAARALLSIFLSIRLRFGSDGFAACASGCNPHCHFVLLLQSVSFDHSILLDFLISAETCFLEYFVRYLKYLRDDWRGFTAACGGVSLSHCRQSLPVSCAADRSEPDKVEFTSCVRPPAGVNPPVERLRLAAELRLVEYDSSDESDPENMEVSQVGPGASFSAVDVEQETDGRPVPIRWKHDAPSLSEPNSTPERRAEGFQSEPTSVRAVLCLSELREVVTRLHAKKLFPYNPSSLLKLLTQVETLFQAATAQ